MKYKLVIFDLDGTLIDTIADLGGAANEVLRVKGFPRHTLEEYRGMVGHGVRNLVRKAMPVALQEDEALLDELLALFLDYYLQHIDERSRPYPGIPELLADLQAAGAQLAVASNKFQAGTEKLIRRMFPEIGFAVVLGGRSGAPLKPDPAIVETIRGQVGISAEETVMVGDSATDIHTAEGAGVGCIAVSWGFRPREALSEAPLVVDTVSQLRDALLAE